MVSSTLSFDEQGHITKMKTARYWTADGSYSRWWVGYYRDYTKVNDMMMPKEIEAAWNLGSGEFSYAKFKVTYIEYNNPSIYKK